MNLGDQLDELRDNILRDTSDLIGGPQDDLWSDATLLRYIEDAERRFARQTLIIRDATTPACTQVVLQTGVSMYPLHPSVLAVISANYTPAGGQQYDLYRSGHALVAQTVPLEALQFDPTNPYSSALPPGAPLAYFTDETLVYAQQSRVTLTVYPAPSDTQNGTIVPMRVIRLPMCGYGQKDLGRESEIPKDYQLDVLEWAAYRAQRNWDGDGGAPTSAAQHKQAFDDAVTQAEKETKRKMFANTAIRYGANGFSWTR